VAENRLGWKVIRSILSRCSWGK